MPDQTERTAFLSSAQDQGERARGHVVLRLHSADELGKLTTDVGLTDLEVLLRSALDGGRRTRHAVLPRAQEKRLIERQAQGMLEFIEPKWSLATVVGHEGAEKLGCSTTPS